jgi:hypothetical protein
LAAVTWLALATSAFAQSVDLLTIPPSGEPWSIQRAADIPTQLQQAIARQRSCRFEDWLADIPIVIFRPTSQSRVMAIVPCGNIIAYSNAFLFERDPRLEPRLMVFPVVAYEGRFTASASAGLLSWNPQTKTLVAYRGNDVGGTPVYRHTYRHNGGGDVNVVGLNDINGFELVKFERGTLGFGKPENWQTVWEPSAWDLPR